ncbi:Uncharacterized protein dnm_014840 [Desulfonema magnum]|uniref:Uncharacterized protein n=1 Tax=Desulfonema magnum TaxID=45655 RepID=A0A975BHL5_9BACT|nr:Uncharacterized protein dnm_014840 [Desulfonema magnum]
MRIRSAKIVFLQLRKSISRTCEKVFLALAKKNFSHSGENAGKAVQF